MTRSRCLPHSVLTMILTGLLGGVSLAQNPIITSQFTADPAARVFEGKVYLYPSHDIPPGNGRGRPGWFCMEDYHVFSSENLTDWTDHGVIVSQDNVPWVNAKAYALWAPDCIARNGKYYFYFPAPARDTTLGRGFSIGVAVADKPSGPFVPLPAPIPGVRGIDPNVFMDRDGQAYLYWSARKFFVAKLKEDMAGLASEPRELEGLPEKGLKEGPFLFERNGTYYLTYPHVQDSTERLEYAVSSNPMGPFKVTGVLMDATPDCWTNQSSVVLFKGQWYLFYHHNDLSPHFDKNRAVRIDSLFFNTDGTMRKVMPTLRGVGLTDAFGQIQIDRYSARSETGVSIAFLDSLHPFGGWKTTFDTAGAWVRYNSVDFGNRSTKSVQMRACSKTGGTLQVLLDTPDGPPAVEIGIPRSEGWTTVEGRVQESRAGAYNRIVQMTGIHHLIVRLSQGSDVEIDWVRFE